MLRVKSQGGWGNNCSSSSACNRPMREWHSFRPKTSCWKVHGQGRFLSLKHCLRLREHFNKQYSLSPDPHWCFQINCLPHKIKWQLRESQDMIWYYINLKRNLDDDDDDDDDDGQWKWKVVKSNSNSQRACLGVAAQWGAQSGKKNRPGPPPGWGNHPIPSKYYRSGLKILYIYHIYNILFNNYYYYY